MRRLRAFTLFALALAGATARAEVSCPPVFGDHMVLQRDRAVPIWGTAAPGEKVTVEFEGQVQSAIADDSGAWRVALDPLSANAEPHRLTVRGTNSLSFDDVLVGEVWFCSGQSNMEKPLGLKGGQKPTDGHEQAISKAAHPRLRLFHVPHYGKASKKVLGLRWVACTPETVQATEFSAAAYYFGRELLQEIDVPIGLIHSSFGGTQIEAWTPPGAFDRVPGLAEKAMEPFFAWVKGVQATELYQSMVKPFVPYSVRGFLWYQGESNLMSGDSAIYTDKMRVLVESWREVWGIRNAPFLYVLIAPYRYSKDSHVSKRLTSEALPLFWEAQAQALAITNTGMIVTTDLAGDASDIHPTNKMDVGMRLARLALAKVYGRNDLPAESPRYSSMEVIANGSIELDFTGASGGLVTRDGNRPTHFEIAGEDRVFHPGTASISGTKVIVSSGEIPHPVAVRFGWNEAANPNLTNSAGLPVIPFRTDAWPVQSELPAPAPGSAAPASTAPSN